MSRSSFRRDFVRSQEAVVALLDYFIDEGHIAWELEKDEQHLGDIYTEQFGVQVHVEVKFDIMAARTGNLCFEMSNGTKMTGIMTTQADEIFYVVPDGNKKKVFVFDPDKLRSYIKNLPVKNIKNGGDKKKFILAVVSIQDIIDAELPERVFHL